MAVDAARAKSLFLNASDLSDPAERAAYLERECGGDAELRGRVEALLRANDASPLPPGGSGEARGAHASERQPETEDYGDPTARVGSILAGRYKLIEEIGAGGMGSVYMAQQTEPVKRAVAVKVIKAGMDSKAVLARFEAERQALAMMDHPNIARVLDAGTTDGGRPFFVMELVKGTPITQFCDERKLTPRQHLELFVPVCQAIQHAHQKGIIHRDIKPSNVLVAMYDDVSVPKVIDFGVAKAAGQALTDKTLMTGFGAVVGTAEYMSPEQANLNNLDIDTRSDVYSLGVLLYELLTGSTPVDRKSLGKAALLEILRIVREVEAPRPSAKLSTVDTLPSVAANRGIEPAKLSRLMKGELDWLVMKALEKDRARRYETANGFAMDVRRYLAGEPVLAAPPGARYRLRKFAWKHRAALATAAALALLLVVGVAVSTWQAVRATRAEAVALQAQQAEAERAEGERLARLESQANEKLAGERLVQLEAEKKKAEAEKRVAQAVKDFLQYKLLAQANPGAQANALLKAGESSSGVKVNPTIRELLDRAARELTGDKIEKSFPKQPLTQAEILQTIGNTYIWLDESQRAINFLKRSEALRRQHLGPEHPATISSMSNLAMAYHGAGKLDLALPLFEETLRFRKAKFGPKHPVTLISMSALAMAYQAAGKHNLALPLCEQTLKLMKAKLGPEHPDTLGGMHYLAMAYQSAGKLDLALPLFEETLRLRKAKLGPEDPATLGSMSALASAYQAAGKMGLALPLFEATLRLRKVKLGPEHPETLASLSALIQAYLAAGKSALPLLEETLKLTKAKFGPDHLATLNSMSNLASAYQFAGKLDLALPLREEAFKLFKARFGPEHPDTLGSMSVLAEAYQSAGKHDLALPLLKETLKLTKAKLGPDHPSTLYAMHILANAYAAAGKPDLALPLFEENLKLTKAKFGPEHLLTRMSMRSLAWGYLAVAAHQAWFGRDKELAATCGHALQLAKESNDPTTLERVAKTCSLRPTADPSRHAVALMLARKAVERGKGHLFMPWFQLALGMAEYRSGHFAEADAALTAAGRAGGTGEFYRAMSLFRQGKRAEARRLANAAAARMKPLPKDKKNPLADNADHDNLILWLAYKEAKRLIGFDATPAAAPRRNASPPRKKK